MLCGEKVYNVGQKRRACTDVELVRDSQEPIIQGDIPSVSVLRVKHSHQRIEQLLAELYLLFFRCECSDDTRHNVMFNPYFVTMLAIHNKQADGRQIRDRPSDILRLDAKIKRPE